MTFALRGTPLKSSTFNGRPPVVRVGGFASRPVRALRMTIENKTRWELAVDQAWCDANKKECAELEASLDLTDVISEKLSALVGETRDCDFGVRCDRTGVKVKFDSIGASNPLDSPSELYLTDVGGRTHVTVDGQQLRHNERVRVKPGSSVTFGDFARFKVLRNVEAHA